MQLKSRLCGTKHWQDYSDECDDPTDNTVYKRWGSLIAHVKTVDPKKAQLLTAERKRKRKGKRKIIPTSKENSHQVLCSLFTDYHLS